MLYSILSYENQANIDDSKDKVMISANSKGAKSKGGVLKGKVVAVTKLMRMYKVLKEKQNNIVQLKQLSPNGMIPHGVLAGGTKEIEKVIASFNSAKKADAVNEANPNASKNNKNAKNIKGKVAFFKKNMDKVKEKTDEKAQTKTKRRKMTITKEDAPPPSKPK